MNLLQRVLGRPATPRPELHGETDRQRYFLDGYLVGDLIAGPARQQLLTALRDLRGGRVRDGFRLEQKYAHTKDLRPQAADYDPAVIDVLFESGVPGLLKRATGLDLWLAHVQIRIVFPGSSYMDWHRDTHTYGGNLVGTIPPLHKLILYPAFGEPATPQLLVSPGSHRQVLADEKRDLQQVKERPAPTISTADDRFLLFDTSLLHAVVPERDPRGSLRVIYAFGDESQLAPFTGSQGLQARYRERAEAV